VAVCLEAVNRGRIGPDDSVLIVGDGPFDILIARLLAAKHPARTIVVGHHQFRLRHFKGAVTIRTSPDDDVVKLVTEANGGTGIDVAILAVSRGEALDLCLQALRPRGRVVVFSAVHNPPSVDFFRLHIKELEILGACNDEDLIDEALAAISDPANAIDSLVSHALPFDEWQRAFHLASQSHEQALKVAMTFAGVS
jgi:threonine dehydrogenase-like Zn-dependent dehydrogenase